MTLNALSSMIIFALLLIASVLLFVLFRKKNKDPENFDATKEYTLFASSVIFASIAGFAIYTVQKELLIASFIENQKIICVQGNQATVISKQDGYTFQKERFFRNKEVYNLENCRKF